MFKRRTLAIALLIASVCALLPLTLGAGAQDMGTMTIEVAANATRFVIQPQPVDEDGMPLNGNPFIISGYIYPEGTLTASNGVLEDGSPEVPDLVIGTWICSGFFYGDLPTATGPYAVTTQVFDFDTAAPGEMTIMTYGYEIIDIGVPLQRAVIGGTGEHAGASGLQIQTYLGDNPTFGPNLVITLPTN